MVLPVNPAAITQSAPDQIALSGCWTAHTVKDMERQLNALSVSDVGSIVVDGKQLEAIDSIGAWVLQRWLKRVHKKGLKVRLLNWSPRFQKLMDLVAEQIDVKILHEQRRTLLERVGVMAEAAWQEAFALMSFIGECAVVLMRRVTHLKPWRWRQILYNIEKSGFDALSIVGLTSFLLGIVVAYQGAGQLKLYSANIFVVELVGFSMLREFSPLITAILIAGRSGSAYAAQIGTMVVTDEIEALRTIGIEPIDLLVWPKIFALMIALPLLTIFADITGVLGGMVMARTQLDVGFYEFIDRFGKEIRLSALLIGAGKAVVFALVIAVIGCFQGFRTQSNAESVGRQTTRSVVQAIFIMIVADALFSVIFTMLNI